MRIWVIVTCSTLLASAESKLSDATIQLEAWFPSATRSLTDFETTIFEKLSRDYLRVQEILLERLEVTDQGFNDPTTDMIPAFPVANATVEVVLVGSLNVVEHPPPIWTVSMEITALNAGDIKPLLEEDSSTYLRFLRLGLEDVFPKKFSQGKIGSDNNSSNSEDGDAGWRWLIAALFMSLGAMATVVFVRVSGRQHRPWQPQFLSEDSIGEESVVSSPLPSLFSSVAKNVALDSGGSTDVDGGGSTQDFLAQHERYRPAPAVDSNDEASSSSREQWKRTLVWL